jgi:hypothetical protein
MATTPSAHQELRPQIEPDRDDTPSVDVDAPASPRHERDARAEIDRLLGEVQRLVSNEGDVHARDAVDSALAQVTRLQIVTANLDACKPLRARDAGAALTALADARLMGHPDAIERGMTYTADNQIRLLQNP